MARESFGVLWAAFALAASGICVAQNDGGVASRPAETSPKDDSEKLDPQKEFWEGQLIYRTDSTPAAGLDVSLVSEGAILGTTKTDSFGKFTLVKPKARFWLKATHDGMVDFSGTYEPGTLSQVSTFPVKSFASLQLKITGLGGLGIPYVDVEFKGRWRVERRQIRAGEEEPLLLDDLEDQHFDIKILAPFKVPLVCDQVHIKKRARLTREIRVPKIGKVSGRVRPVEGDSLRALVLRAIPLDPPLSDLCKFAAEALSDQAGNYHFDCLAPGNYAIQFIDPAGYPVLDHRAIALGPGEHVNVPDLWYLAKPKASRSEALDSYRRETGAIPPIVGEKRPFDGTVDGTIQGSVTTYSGLPLPFAQIDLWTDPQTQSRPFRIFADKSGQFQVSRLARKAWTLRAIPRGLAGLVPNHSAGQAMVILDSSPEQLLKLEVALPSDAASSWRTLGIAFDEPLRVRAVARGVSFPRAWFVVESRSRAARGWSPPYPNELQSDLNRQSVGGMEWTDLGLPEPAGDEAAICYWQGESSRGCVSAATVGRPLVHTATRGWCDFQLSDAAIVGKMVSTETNLPLRAALRLEPDGELVRSGAPFSIATVESDAEGTFVLQRVAPGPYELVVERGKHGDRAEPGQRMPVTVREDGIERVRWAVRPGTSLVVKVVDATGAPIANAHVTLRPKEGDGTPQGATTRDRGAATFHSLIDGPVLVEAVELLEPGSSRAARKSEPLQAVIRKDAQQTLQIALLPRVVVRVEADGAEPEVLGRLRLRVYDERGREMPIGRSDWEPNTTYREFVSHLRSGEYTLEASAPGLPIQIIPFRVGADPVEPIRVRLKAK